MLIETVLYFRTPKQEQQISNFNGTWITQKLSPEVFYKKTVHKNFAVFTRKHLCLSVSGLEDWNFTKKRLQHKCFPENTAKFLRISNLKNSWEQLLLCKYKKNFVLQIRVTIDGATSRSILGIAFKFWSPEIIRSRISSSQKA